MSTMVGPAFPAQADASRRALRWVSERVSAASVAWPVLVAVANAVAFYVVQPNVADLQAALARQSAAAHGVGLTYWFQWFGGGEAPGNYSVVTPYLSSLVGAPLLGVLATIAITPLAAQALSASRFATSATWVATAAAGLNLWSGRIPFALGCAAGVLACLAVRRGIWTLAVAAGVGASLCSPVCGAFLGLGLLGTMLTDRDRRPLAVTVGAACTATLLLVAVYFGMPGPQPYSPKQEIFAVATAACMLLARPPRPVRLVLLATIAAAVLLAVFPNGMGSNVIRFPYLCLPAVVVATAGRLRVVAVLSVIPALLATAQVTVADLALARAPGAATSYYRPLIDELRSQPGVANSRLEVVQNVDLHTAAYALVDHVALAGGWETQQQNAFNGVLHSPTALDAVSYKIWLDNTAVGYVAFDRKSRSDGPEYKLVASRRLTYLTPVWHDRAWILYRVSAPTLIVAAPQRLVDATQSTLTIAVPCACTFNVRVRYSKFLVAAHAASGQRAQVGNDGAGWTTVTTPTAGRYALHGMLTH